MWKNALSLGSVLTSTAVLAYNSTEKLRMSRNIQQGKLRHKSNLTPQQKFCQFPIDKLEQVVKSGPNLFCGIVGLKSTGKTSTLHIVAEELPNVVFLELGQNEDLYNGLHERLKTSVFHLPWFLDRIRLDSHLTSKDIVTEVFLDVQESSGTCVTAIIDLVAPSPLHTPSFSMPGVIERPRDFLPKHSNTRYFVQQVKSLVSTGVMQCLFSASEGCGFQSERFYEPRLQLFMSSELPISISEQYLQYLNPNKQIQQHEKALLYDFPRTFSTLVAFHDQSDKETFVQKQFVDVQDKIQKSIKMNPNVVKLYDLILKQDVRVPDIFDLQLTEAQIQTLIEDNILCLNLEGTLTFQYDATAKAVKQLLERPRGWLDFRL